MPQVRNLDRSLLPRRWRASPSEPGETMVDTRGDTATQHVPVQIIDSLLACRGDVSIPGMPPEEDFDPMDPEAWSGRAGVCGGCIAWKPDDPRPGEETAAGSCRLRRELARVPASMKLCSIYKPRGQFVYQPGRTPPSSPKRRTNKVISIVRVTEDGRVVSGKARSTPKAPPASLELAPQTTSSGTDWTLPRSSDLDETRPPRPPVPARVDLGEDESAPVLRQALVEMVRGELGRSKRELHPKFKRGGTAVARDSAGASVTISAERFFASLDRIQSTLAALEAEITSRAAAFGEESREMIDSLGRIRGSLTTFNILFSDREDWFSSK